MDTIAPTAERLRHAESYDAPHRSQTVNRVAYRVHTPFEAMERRGDITPAQLRAGQKLTRHYHGALGVNVGNGDGYPDTDAEYPQIYHGQMCAQAKATLLPRQYQALEWMIGESHSLEDIGRLWMGCRQRGQAHIAGKALVVLALERLAVLWRFK